MKISKRTREQAWLICAMWASSDGRLGCFEAIEAVGAECGDSAATLAEKAYDAAGVNHPYPPPVVAEYDWRERYAEAAALLVEGWCPP